MKKYLFISLSVFCMYSCGGAPPIENKENKNGKEAPISAPKELKFECQNFEEDETGKMAIVSLLVDGKELYRDTIAACEEFSKEQYAQMGVPADAADIAGGWWAGGGDYFYAIVKEGRVQLFKGWIEEGQEDDSYHWEEIKL